MTGSGWPSAGDRGGACYARAREGSTLVVALLLLLAGTALAHAAYVLAMQELRIARAAVDVLQARVVAQSLTRGPVAMIDSLVWRVDVGRSAVLREGTLARGAWRRRVRRLAPELWMIEGSATSGRATQRMGRVVWLMDPVARLAAARGVVETEAPYPERGVRTEGLRSPPPPWSAGRCASWRPVIDSLYRARALPPTAPRGGRGAGSGEPWLGLLDGEALMRRIERRVSGSGAPSPTERRGACLTEDPWNWGAPSDPGSRCGSFSPVVASAADLAVTAGQGQGVLVVGGNLRMSGASSYYGVVLVSGRVRLEHGARIYGLVRSARLVVEDSARVAGSACAALRALDGARSTLGPSVPSPGSGWLGPF